MRMRCPLAPPRTQNEASRIMRLIHLQRGKKKHGGPVEGIRFYTANAFWITETKDGSKIRQRTDFFNRFIAEVYFIKYFQIIRTLVQFILG